MSDLEPIGKRIDDTIGRLFPKAAIRAWAQSVTNPGSTRYEELWVAKVHIINRFILYVKKHPADVGPEDVGNWRAYLEERYKPVTVYAMLCQLSSFYKWAMQEPMMNVQFNPVRLVMPKHPIPYQGDTVKALTPQQVKALLDTVRAKGDTGDVVAKRDYALLLFYLATGMRRSEIISLRWGDVEMGKIDTITTRTKGGAIVSIEIADERVWRVLFDYLEASGRLESMENDTPLWARHDALAAGLHARLGSAGFVKNLKAYAQESGIGHIHLHQTRHTVAQQVAEEDGIAEAQEVLGHKSLATTRIYAGRLIRRRDKHSKRLLDEILPND